jgi:hypothetical protein
MFHDVYQQSRSSFQSTSRFQGNTTMATESEQPRKRRKLEPSFAYAPFGVGKGDLLTSGLIRSPEAIVTFLIGPGDSPKKFIVHKEPACYHSPILDAAFNGNFVEGQTQTYRIEDTSPEAFRFFVQWLYRQELDLFQLKSLAVEEDEEPKQSYDEDIALAELWVLAEKMAVPALQNLVIEKIIAIRENTIAVPTATIPYIYQRTAIIARFVA